MPGSAVATRMFPLESVLLPGDELPLHIFEPRYQQMITECLDHDEPFGVVLISAGREVGGADARNDVAASARIVDHRRSGDGRFVLRAEIGDRMRVTGWLDDDPYPRADTSPWPDEPGAAVGVEDLADLEDRIMALFGRIATAQSMQLPSRYELLGDVEPGQDAGQRLYRLAARVPLGQADRYALLAAPSAADRLAAFGEALDTLDAVVAFQLAKDD